MIANENMPAMLNEQQVMMLPLLKKPLPEEDFKQMQPLAVKLLAKQLDENMADWKEKENVNKEDYEAMLDNHFRK